ncbi:MAG TPA: class I SAM-dependent methyltransferase [Chloroflexota bacterium]|jgi:SAM-dependent methyltransferase|nr:class I SAM-dependent methyltransferase [Chloroflexota bacterium]
MGIPRDLTVRLLWALDELLPPVLRDSPRVMALPMRLALGRHAAEFERFKAAAPDLDAEGYAAVYARLRGAFVDRPTDLNRRCLAAIEAHVVGPRVLDVGSGSGYLVERLARRHRVVGCDLYVDPALGARRGARSYCQANAEELPFRDRRFDTVVCAHTLEHVQNLARTVAELRRVAARRLIVVVPRQRPYRWTFDLHLHFFPYPHSLRLAIGRADGPSSCRVVGGDLFYVEER